MDGKSAFPAPAPAGDSVRAVGVHSLAHTRSLTLATSCTGFYVWLFHSRHKTTLWDRDRADPSLFSGAPGRVQPRRRRPAALRCGTSCAERHVTGAFLACLASLFLLGGNPSPSLSDCLADLLTPPLHSAFSRAEGRPGTRAWPALPPGSAATPAGAEGRPRGRPSPQSQPCHAAGSQDPGKLRSVCSVICSGHGHMQPALEGGPGRAELSRGWVGAGHQDHVSGARRCRAGVPRKWGGRG